MTATVDFIAAYRRTAEEGRPELLRGCEAGADRELVDFLITVAEDTTEFDLARIEAIRSLGLIASETGEEPGRLFEDDLDAAAAVIVDMLAGIANLDPDEDVRVWSLRALAWCDLSETALKVPAALALAPDEDPLLREVAFEAVLAQSPQSAVRAETLGLLAADPLFAEAVATDLEAQNR